MAELELHKAGGFATLEGYAEEVFDLSRGTAFQYVRVAAAFSEEVAAAYGPEKLDRALAYIAKTPEDEEPSDIPTMRFRVPDEQGRGVVKRPLSEMTTADLRWAVQLAGSGGRKKKKANGLGAEVAVAVARADKALDRAVGRGRARDADVLARLVGGDVRVDVRGVPLPRARAAFTALAKAFGTS